MSGITGLGTTYNLLNYTGDIIALTPAETPFLSAIGGLSGGGQCTSTEFEWTTFDYRSASQNVVAEGATAPTAVARVRANVTNVPEIHQSKVSVSYSKMAAYGLKNGTNNALPNNVTQEDVWQIEQEIKQMALDVNYSLINGVYRKPTDNTTNRQTRGMTHAITTNAVNKGTVVVATGRTITASTDLVTATAHGLAAHSRVFLRNISVLGTGLNETTLYYVETVLTNTFALSLTNGGAAVDVLVDCTADIYVPTATAVSVLDVESALQSAYDNGGISDATTATLLCNSGIKRDLTTAYGNAYGKYYELQRHVAGIAVDTIVTNFGVINVMMDRAVPKHGFMVVSMDQCTPVFLETPGKGHFFAEPLAKVGASDDTQLYGEVGLAYGNEKAHAYYYGYTPTGV